MKLDNPILLTPPPITNNGKIIQSEPVTITYLNVIFLDDPQQKIYYCNIQGFPNPIVLYADPEYSSVESINKIMGYERLKIKLGDNPSKVLRSLFPRTLEEDPHGPGTVLSQMIKSLGIVMTEGCSCRRHAIQMNEKGNDWCEANINTILGWLREESKKRKLPFVDAIGKLMIHRAIKKSKKLLANEPIPATDEELDSL